MSLNGIFAASANAGVKSVDYTKPKFGNDDGNTFGNSSRNQPDLAELFAQMSKGPSYTSPSANDAMYEPQAKSSYESVFIDPEPDVTLMDDLDAGHNVDRSPPNLVVQNLMLDPNKPAPEAEKTHDKAVNAHDDVKEKMGLLEQDFSAHQSRATEYLKEAAEGMGMNGDDVVGQMLPQQSNSKASAATAIASQAVTGAGAGSLAAAAGALGNAAYGAEKVAEDRKDLTADQKKALIEEVCKIAQSKAPPDTRASSSVSAKGGYAPDDVDKNLAKLSEAKMEKLLTQTVEQQPEHKALAKMDHDLNVVMDNHKDFAYSYGKNNIYDKTVSLAQGDNKVAEKIILEAQIIQAPVFATNDSKFDAGHASLTGDSVAGGIKIPNIPPNSIDLKSVATVVDFRAFAAKEAVASAELNNYARNAMGMSA